MSNSSSRFYNYFSFIYPLIDIFLFTHKKHLVKKLNTYPSGKLLEIGVGSGSHLKLYAKHSIVGIDSSQTMLNRAKKNNNGKAQLLLMKGEQLQFEENSFDYVVLAHVISVVNNPDELLNEVYRVLKSKGKIIILNHFTPENFLKYFDKLFSVFSKLFYFKSYFHIENITAIKKYNIIEEQTLGYLSYYKLIILEKK